MQVWLFGIFLYLFGEPAVERYLDEKVMVVTSTRETGGTEAPALTIVVTQTGWKRKLSGTNYIRSFCSELDSDKSIIGCIEENTYNISEISQGGAIGLPGSSIENVIKGPWVEDFTYSFMGRTYTLNITKKLRYASLTDGILRIGLNKSLEYHVFIPEVSE